MKDHIIICGLGTVGFQTFKILKQTQQKIVVISDKTEEEWRWQVEDAGGIFFLGDARNDKLLIKAGIQHAKAILALTDHDMVNVSIAIDARKLNPQIKIILRMFDNALGEHIAKTYGIHQVFSTTNLVAPIFASSAHESLAIAQFQIQKINYFVFEEQGFPENTAAPILAVLPRNAKVESTPYLVAHAADSYKKKQDDFLNIYKNLNRLRSPVYANFRRFLLILFAVIISAAFLIKWEMSLTYTDAIYFATTTVTTVGYGDFNFSHAPAWLKIFGCFLMLSGGAALAMLFSSITEILLSKKLPNIFGGQPVPKKNHIIVVGTGQFGHQLVSLLLADKIPIVIMEGSQQDHYSEDINREVSLVDGNLRSEETLNRARVKSAKAIIVITDNDVENLSVSLAAKKMNPNIFNIAHVFNYDLGKRLQNSLALDRILSMPNIVAPYFAAAVFGERILLALNWKNHLIFISQNTEEALGSRANSLTIDGKTYHDIRIHTLPLT